MVYIPNNMKIIKPQCSSTKGNLAYYISQYCSNASIHGLKFLGEPKRFLIERIWWFLFISVSLFFCTNLIFETYTKWINAPVIVSFATSATQIWEIPFPTVTICPFVKSTRSKYDWTSELRLRRNHSSDVSEEERKFRYMSLLCSTKIAAFDEGNLTDTVEDDIIPFIIDVGVDFNYTLHSCKWLGFDCSNSAHTLFTPMLTADGICYSMNMLNPEEIYRDAAEIGYYKNFVDNENQPLSQWTIENGYVHDNHVYSYPLRTVLSGPPGGLDLVLYTRHEDIDHNCGDSVEGFKVLLHHPAEIPRSTQRFFWIPLDADVIAAVKPNMMTTSPRLRNYRPRHRKCYFINERTLKYYKIYNQQNCILECLASFTYRSCNCVAYNMPRDNSTAICGPAMKDCMESANYMFMVHEASFQAKRLKNYKTSRYKNKTDCNCLQSCHALTYDVETSQMEWNWSRGDVLKEGYDREGAHLSRLRIFYQDLQFMTSERNELYGQTDFWANCGGLLGLFTGFSFISLIEILYFASLRLACNLKKYGMGYWSGADELVHSEQ